MILFQIVLSHAFEKIRADTISKIKVQSSEFKVQSSKFKVQSSKFKVQSLRFKVFQSNVFKCLSAILKFATLFFLNQNCIFLFATLFPHTFLTLFRKATSPLILNVSGSFGNSTQCFVPGECLQGTLIKGSKTLSGNACLSFCKKVAGCEFFTFYPESLICTALKGKI